MTDKEKILGFLKSQSMATISTIAPGTLQPESALIAFTQTEKLEIIFESFVNTRKWENLQRNPHVAFVIGWDTKKHITIQYEGEAAAITENEVENYIRLFVAKDTPCTEKFLRDPRVRLFKTVPKWIRYSDYTRDSPRIAEIDF